MLVTSAKIARICKFFVQPYSKDLKHNIDLIFEEAVFREKNRQSYNLD